MPTELLIEDQAVEKSSYFITCSFKDEDGQPVTPTAAKWSLTNTAGTIINSRDEVAMSLATQVTVALSGLDLAISGSGQRETRVFTVQATYTSDAVDYPLKDSLKFPVYNLVGIT
jgi:hypothetical protein